MNSDASPETAARGLAAPAPTPASPLPMREARPELVAPASRIDPEVPGLFSANPVPMWIFDVESMRILAVNAAACALYGWTRDEFLQRTILDLREPSEHRALVEHVRQSPPGLHDSGSWRHRRADGSSIEVEITSHAVEFGGRSARLVSVRDVSARVRAEQALRESEARYRRTVEELEASVQRRTLELQELHREARSYALTVAHDLRAPLRVLQGFSHILREDHAAELGSEAKVLLERIGEAALKLDQIVSGHLTLAHLERHELHLQDLDLRELVDDVVREHVASLEGRRVEFQVGRLPVVRGDETLLRQVFSNLVSNALKFTRERPCAHIEIGCREQAGEILCFVRDDGVGFDPAQAGTLFTPFRRLEERFEGTGIGLATVARILERHGGRVWAEGAPERGATFWFTLGAAGSTDGA